MTLHTQSTVFQKLLVAVLFVTFFPSVSKAQDEEDFDRLARRSIDAYEAELKKKQPGYDSAVWHGATYIGTSSRGHILPNAFFNYKNGKVRMKGDVVMDFSDVDTKRYEEGNYASGAYQETFTNIKKRYEHEDLTFRIDYLLDKQNTISFDLFEKYRADRISETATLYKTSADGENADSYEDQRRKTWNINCGSLVEFLHSFNAGGSFSARAYIKYDNNPTYIYRVVLSDEQGYVTTDDHQNHHSTDTKGQLLFHSPVWNGFSFSLREKVGLMQTRIKDAVSAFDYDVNQTLTSGALNYKKGAFSFVVQGGYETYHHNIKTLGGAHKDNVKHTYRDFVYNVSATWKVNARNSLNASFDYSINRPTYTQLYPFIHVGSNIGSRVKGNEDLQPSTVNQVKCKYTYSVPHITLNTILTYQKKTDDITGIAIYDEIEQMNVKTWINDAEYNSIKGALEGELRYGNFSMTMGARAQKLWYEGENVSNDKSWSYSFKARPQLKLPDEWMLSTVILYNGREEHLHWYSKAYTYLAFRAQKQLGDWAVYAFVQDIINGSRVKNEYSKNNAILTSNEYNARALIIGCSYRF